jgi:cytochrome c-type biogenesis protein CcmE
VRPGYFVGGFVILFCVVVTAMALSGTVRRTVTIQEALASQQPCEIYGEVVPNSAKMDPVSGQFSFRLRETETNAEITVLSLKPKPSNFDQASHVKAIGAVEGSEFSAHDLLIKCPSKYQGVKKPKELAEARRAELEGLR